MPDVLAWDIETAPDLRVFCCYYGLEGKSDDEVHDAMSDRFPSTASVWCVFGHTPIA